MTAVTPGREELAIACLRRLTQVNMWSEKQRDLAGEDIKSTLEKIDRLAVKPDKDGVREATIRECADIARACEDGRDAADAILALSTTGKPKPDKSYLPFWGTSEP